MFSSCLIQLIVAGMIAAQPGGRGGPRIGDAAPTGIEAHELLAPPNAPGLVLVKSFRVIDVNGDLDGFPDTNETFDLLVSVSNKSGQDVTNLVARIATDDPRIDCILTPVVSIGNVAAGVDAEAPSAFRLHVHPRADRGGPSVVCDDPGPFGRCSNFVAGACFADADCRRGVLEDYPVELSVALSADQFAAERRPQRIRLDLDLDSVHPTGPTTTFVEGFESPFGGFTLMTLDTGKASVSASDGYRCQYNDPDSPNSTTFGDPWCYLGFESGQTPENDWHRHTTSAPDGGRAFLGQASMHYGKHASGDPGLDTYGLAQMDAFFPNSVRLAARVCRDDPAANKRSCNASADCLAVGGGPCVSASPELSFKHQLSTPVSAFGTAVDRAVVQVQIQGAASWRNVSPFKNIYDMLASAEYADCRFDPIDDGNDEDSYFDPTDPNRRFGPSSTCSPEPVFAYLGNTADPFNAQNVGNASDGPGLQGSLGRGTWVESRFDLSAFRGRTILVRFLLTSIRAAQIETWRGLFGLYSDPRDDGWYVDDVRVSQTLGATSPTVSLDNANNGALPGNMDGDARGDACDCAPTNPGSFALPEVVGLRAVDRTNFTWQSAVAAAGADTVHDVVRGRLVELPVGSGASETCIASGVQPDVADPSVPEAGSGYWYLVRASNACGKGTYGRRSDGVERTTFACP